VIPVTDLSEFVGGSDARRRSIGAQIDQACREVGFLAVVGPGVPDATIERLHSEALAFFDLPLHDRLAAVMPRPGYPYGYNPVEAESLNRSIGGAAAPDAKETFNVGPIEPPPRAVDEMDDPDERAVHSANLWPPMLPTLRPAVEAYYREMERLSATLMQAFAVALGLDDDAFAPFIDRHGSALRLAHYPASDVLADDGVGRFRAGAHTDYGTLTVLWTDGEPGLQVYLPETGWTSVAATEGGLLVNLGDLMARWTNERWRSTLHRVVSAGSGRRRLSIPFFHNANWDARIECIVGDGGVPRHPPTTAGKHLMEKFRSTVV
jgi:isopenicillin N synthase-like dioxygenase